jgi:hypothetical protein
LIWVKCELGWIGSLDLTGYLYLWTLVALITYQIVTYRYFYPSYVASYVVSRQEFYAWSWQESRPIMVNGVRIRKKKGTISFSNFSIVQFLFPKRFWAILTLKFAPSLFGSPPTHISSIIGRLGSFYWFAISTCLPKLKTSATAIEKGLKPLDARTDSRIRFN